MPGNKRTYTYAYESGFTSIRYIDSSFRVAKSVIESADLRMHEKALWREVHEFIKSRNIPAPMPPYFDENYFSDFCQKETVEDETVGPCPSRYFDYEKTYL